MCKSHIYQGKIDIKSEIKFNEDADIRELDKKEPYKYLGIDEGDGIQDTKMKRKIRKECYRRVRATLHTELNAKK